MNMKIENIKIKNFKNLKSININNIGDINIIVGRNNTGKTSLLQAIMLAEYPEYFPIDYINRYHLNSIDNLINYSSKSSTIEITVNKPVDNRLHIEINRPKIGESIEVITEALKQNLKKNLNYALKTGIKRSGKEIKKPLQDEEIDVSINNYIQENMETIVNNIHKDIVIKGRYYFSIEMIELMENIMQQIMEKYKISSTFRILPGNVWGEVAYLPFRNSYRVLPFTKNKEMRSFNNKDIILINPKIRIQDLNNNETLSLKIENLIKENGILPDMERFSFKNLVFNVDGEFKEVPFQLMGEGFQVLISLISQILSCQNKRTKPVILIEEPEVHMHPGYIDEFVNYVMSFYINNNVQFFISTHSDDFINGFLNNDLKPEIKSKIEKGFRVFRLNEIEGENLVETLDYKEAIENLDELSLDLRGL